MSSGLSACCAEGVIHEGQPVGKIEKIGGIETYVSKPEKYDEKKAVIILTDVFGVQLVNNKLLADSFAQSAGFQCYVPDYLNGDPITDELLSSSADRMAAIGKWRPSHGPEQTIPPLMKVVEALQAQGVTSMAASAYCFGAPYAIHLAEKGAIKAAALAHPSMLDSARDLPRIKATNVPFIWLTCETDQQWPVEKQKEADDFFKGNDKYERKYYANNNHGFAVRGDISKPEVKKAKEDAFESTAKWFKTYL